MKYIGIDPGTKCGWSILDQDGNRIASGVWDLKSKRHEGGGMRFLRSRRYFSELLATCHADTEQCVVAYEEVRRHAGVSAAHVYGGIVGQITSLCEDFNVPYKGIPVGTIKKHATGKGNANKDQMVQRAKIHWAIPTLTDDNEADALWCADKLREMLNAP